MTFTGDPARSALMNRLVNKTGGVRSEATIQSDVRVLLLDPELGLAEEDLDVQLEVHVGNGRRIDVEVGCTVVEVKRSLTTAAAVSAALVQLADYVTTRSREKSQRYVGVLTDGRLWVAYHEADGQLREVTRHTAVAGAAGAEPLLRWLEGVLATKRAIRPTPAEIADRLGANSSSHALDYATLTALYADSRHLPTVQLKRDLWANLLRSAQGTQFINSDALFLEHTLLVNSAEIIAHLVLGLDVEQLSPATLLSGDQFTVAGLHGVVDRDFFDWVLEVPGGHGYVTALARRLARFDWSHVEHDVLKVLYESIIPAETRKAMGEYYTPDWLANRMITEVVTEPLIQRVLDPSCGSGTFVFYAVRRFLTAAADTGLSLRQAMNLVSSHVMGIDLHPVAVALARVTYLLALGRDRLNAPGRGTLSVPIYLGDSLGWDQREDLMSVDHLLISTEVGDQFLPGELRFPKHLLANSATFDALVQSLVDESGRAVHKPINRLSEGTVRRLALAAEDLPTLNQNFVRLKQLHEAQRNHIWSYYIRNISRPAWLARQENRVDVLIGNPPWLSYRHMTPPMQRRFKLLSQDRGFWHNETTATHQDLAGLFIARAVERYLRSGGRFAFVAPNSVVDRDYWAGFRRGRFQGAAVEFSTSWDLRRIRPHLFLRGAAVIFGTRSLEPHRMPVTALIWSGRAPHRYANQDTASHLTQALGTLTISSDDASDRSPYASRFNNGATLYPRVLFSVTREAPSALGVPAGRAQVRSRRSATEKRPWKDLPDLTGTVETEFLWPTLLGEHIVPFRVLSADEFLLPLTTQGELLTGEHTRIDAYPGLAAWVRNAEALWAEHGRSRLTLAKQIDHMRKLTQQIPPAPIRVAYSASGMHLSAAVVKDSRAVVEHALYWVAVATEAEGHYLAGVLNAPSLTTLVRPLMSYGKDERHIDKHVWKLPIPAYDPTDGTHVEISRLARELTNEFSHLTPRSANFVTTRRDLRAHLAASDRGQQLDRLVIQLLDADISAPSELPQATGATPWLIRTTGAPLDLEPAPVEADVDCEFDEHGRVYQWGALLTYLERPSTYHCFGSTEPDLDELALAQQFTAWLTAHLQNDGRWYHYGSAEAQHLNRLLGPEAQQLLEAATDLLNDVIRPNFYAPGGYGLKSLGTRAGATWRTPGARGADTYTWIAKARAGNHDAWTCLLEYNEDDTRATHLLRQRLRNHTHGPTPSVEVANPS